MTTGRLTMTTEKCPFGGACPHVQTVRDEVEKVDKEIESLRSILNKTNMTLYFIAGVLSLHLGVMLI